MGLLKGHLIDAILRLLAEHLVLGDPAAVGPDARPGGGEPGESLLCRRGGPAGCDRKQGNEREEHGRPTALRPGAILYMVVCLFPLRHLCPCYLAQRPCLAQCPCRSVGAPPPTPCKAPARTASPHPVDGRGWR